MTWKKAPFYYCSFIFLNMILESRWEEKTGEQEMAELRCKDALSMVDKWDYTLETFQELGKCALQLPCLG
jgi:hypothetical protein